MTHRIPRAVNGYDDHVEHQVVELHSGLDDVLTAVRQTAADLLAQSPQPPTTLSVRAGAVAVELTWDASTAAGPVIAVAAPPTTPAATDDPGMVLAASTVGVFYRASAPGATPFVKEGDQVVPGQQVALIEAMKLMLPVEADRPGRIAEVLISDGASVEFGQPLFRLAPLES